MSATKHIQTEGNVGGAPYRVPPEPKRWPAIGLAVGVHALLLAFLVIGLNWQNNEPVAVEAEVWDTTTQTAAPPPPAPEPEPQPETPPPEPVQKAVEPPPPVEQPEVKQPNPPEIALEREKKRKEELKRKQEEERIEHEREVAQQKLADEKKARLLAEKKERDLAEKKAREDADKKELAKKEEADKKKKADKEKAEKLAKDKAEKSRLDKLHDEDVKRMMAAAGNTGSTGNAEKSSAPRRDNGYIAAITAKVKGNSSYGGSEDAPGNPTVTFHVEQLPTGEIISVRKTRSSGIPAFDDAVEKAINKSSPLPKKKDGTVERSLEINFKMKEMQ